MRSHLDPLGLEAAILNVVSGIHAVYDPYLATALCSATNRWLAEEWFARDKRLRGSLLVPFQHPEEAVAEIERHAGDKRFVQILALAMGEMPLGRPHLLADLRGRRETRFSRSPSMPAAPTATR